MNVPFLTRPEVASDATLTAFSYQPAVDVDLETFFLERLADLAARQALATTRKERVALARAAFSIFLDCLDLGLGPEAHVILGHCQKASTRRSVA